MFWKCWTLSGKLWLGLWCNSVQVHPVSLLTQSVEDWPLSFTLGNPTGACQSRSAGPVMTRTSCPSVQGLSVSCLSSSVPFWPEIQADPIHGQHRSSCWPTSRLQSSQTCSPLILSACSVIPAGPPLIQPPPIGSQLLAAWPTFPIANC